MNAAAPPSDVPSNPFSETVSNILQSSGVQQNDMRLLMKKAISYQEVEARSVGNMSLQQHLQVRKTSNQYSQQSVQLAPKAKGLDMAYLYADPVVKMTSEGLLEPVDTPLDLENEYQNVVNNLKNTGKEFQILREAINIKSLDQVIKKNPKIIHISTHGAFDQETKEFYLVIEEEGNGLEEKFTQRRLQNLLCSSNSNGQPNH